MSEKPLRESPGRDTISAGEWIMCPRCHRQRLIRRRENTEIRGALVWCRLCHTEVEINTEQVKEPEP